jgi:long-chain acyl-CoA synthetase
VVPGPIEDTIKLSRFVKQVFVFGDNLPYNVALIVPDFVALKAWAAQSSIPLNNVPPQMQDAHLIEHEKVQELYHVKNKTSLFFLSLMILLFSQEQIKTYCKDLKSYEVPKKFKLLAEEFTVANDLLTPKLSIRRR